jgi:hypothetical protein
MGIGSRLSRAFCQWARSTMVHRLFHAKTQVMQVQIERVEGFDVLVGFFVDGQEVLSFGREEGGVVFGVEG